MKQPVRIVPGAAGAAPPSIAAEDAVAPLHALLERATHAIVALTGARAGAVRLVDEASGTMRLVASIGLPPDWVARERAMDAGCGICGMALQRDCLQLDAQSSACIARSGPFIGETPAGPALALPLHCRGRAIGVFNLFFGAAAAGGEDPARLLAPVADMLDLALENGYLEEERLRASLVAERQLLAAEVHDSLAQGLAFMRMRMTLLHDAIADGERARAIKYYDDVNAALGEAHARLRELITHFRGGIDQGLARALEGTARSFEERTGVKLEVDNRVADLRLSPEQEVQVYRIVQEALANVVKHAGASQACVRLARRGGKLEVSVEDDGHGPGSARAGAPGHYGLDIMRERAQRIGGELAIRKLPRRGTRVRLTVPA